MPKIFCPTCRSHYVGMKVQKDGEQAAVMFCHQCRETWTNTENRDSPTVGMLSEILKDTFN